MEILFENTHSFTDSQKPTITKTSTGEPPAVRVQMSHAPLHRPHDANLLGVVVVAPQPLDERPERAIVKRRQKVAVGRDVDHACLQEGRKNHSARTVLARLSTQHPRPVHRDSSDELVHVVNLRVVEQDRGTPAFRALIWLVCARGRGLGVR